MIDLLPLSSRIYRRLLVLYPEDLRRDYGADMAFVFAEDLEAARREAGLRGVVRVWRCALCEFFRFALPDHASSPAVSVPAIWFALSSIIMSAEVALALRHSPRTPRPSHALCAALLLPSLHHAADVSGGHLGLPRQRHHFPGPVRTPGRDRSAMLEVRDLTKRFGGQTVVDHVNFTVRPGEITGYLGPNGSGKSTTVKMMTGLLHPTEGQILFNGRNIRDDATGFKQRLGYVPEEPNLYGYLTGLEYLQLAGGLRGLPEDRVRQKANELLELLSLRDARWVPISAYSKGMKQRVLIAAALLHDPDVLIFDEAQSGLDIANSLLFRHLLRTLAARGKAILYISHVLELVEKVCEHIVVIYRGRIVADDSVSRLRDLMHLPNLEEIFTQLVEQHDMESRAQEIASVITW